MLTDTTFWIDLFQERRFGKRGRASRFVAANRAQTMSLSIITWGELAEGFNDSSALESVLRNVSVLPLPRHVAWETSRIQRTLLQRLGENDAWIAATALVWGKRLVTNDEAFKRVPRLVTVKY
ncbi:MAG TPA: type II toxin-antitoxin system VapC family toxin [Verrucomicrobiae bacterium]|nr:type II toxin-antitoxin system VapC family toxin [Verrucomicrobiae bacterium]